MSGYWQSVRAEARKLLTVRSTYYVFLSMLVLELLFSFWIFGYKVNVKELGMDGSSYLLDVVANGIFFVAVFPAFVCTLLITHEYRHNTILYALTSSPSRLRVLLAKMKVASLYAIFTTAFFSLLAAGLALLGLHLAGKHLPVQSIPYATLIPEVLFYGWGVAMFGLLIGALVRNQVVAIVSLLVIPNILESILTLLLKSNSVYLPFTALGQVIGDPNGSPSLGSGHLSPLYAAGVFVIYLIVGWAIAAVLFVRRSAN